MKTEIISIGAIGNYYGGLKTKKENNKYYWSIECWGEWTWEQISHNLYMSLLAHNRLNEEKWQTEVMDNY